MVRIFSGAVGPVPLHGYAPKVGTTNLLIQGMISTSQASQLELDISHRWCGRVRRLLAWPHLKMANLLLRTTILLVMSWVCFQRMSCSVAWLTILPRRVLLPLVKKKFLPRNQPKAHCQRQKPPQANLRTAR